MHNGDVELELFIIAFISGVSKPADEGTYITSIGDIWIESADAIEGVVVWCDNGELSSCNWRSDKLISV